ncbi:hypothetical protein GCM10027402_19440 [Arthrobacter monumenti]
MLPERQAETGGIQMHMDVGERGQQQPAAAFNHVAVVLRLWIVRLDGGNPAGAEGHVSGLPAPRPDATKDGVWHGRPPGFSTPGPRTRTS